MKKTKKMIKENPVTLEKWLFGGSYHPFNDPYRSGNMEGWNSFWIENAEETYKSFKTFKETIVTLIEQFGFVDGDGCRDKSELDLDNKDHHNYELPKDEVIKGWFKSETFSLIEDNFDTEKDETWEDYLERKKEDLSENDKIIIKNAITNWHQIS